MKQALKSNKRINILTCANRWGKSVTIACLQIYYLFYKIGINEPEDGNSDSWEKAEYRTANIAPHSANTEAVFKTIHQIMTSSFTIRDPKTGNMTTNKCLIEWAYLKDKTINTPPFKQYFDSNAYIEHRSLGADQGDALQGKPYGIITYDEGGRSDHLEVEIRDAILPRLFDWQGPLYILSTPSATSKSTLYYYGLYMDGTVGVNNTFTQTGSLRDNTFFSEEQIQSQYDLYADDPLKDQILEGKFIFGGNTLFDVQTIVDAQDDSLNNNESFNPGHLYMIGIDTAIGSDEMVYKVIDYTQKPFRQVNQIAVKGNAKSPQAHMYDLTQLFEHYNQQYTCSILLETWNGESVRFYQDLPPHLQAVTTCYGSWQPQAVNTDNQNPLKTKPNNAKKAEILITLKKLLSAHEIKIPKNDQKTIDQLSIYREDDSKLPTDRVMALALACYACEQFAPVNSIEVVDWAW